MPILLSILAILAFLGILQVLLGGSPSDVKLFWVLFILLIPVAGLIFYCLCGINYRYPAVRKRLHGKAVERLKKEITPQQADAWFSDRDLDKVPEEYKPLAQLLLSCGEGNKVYAGNSFEIITSGLRKRNCYWRISARPSTSSIWSIFASGTTRPAAKSGTSCTRKWPKVWRCVF